MSGLELARIARDLIPPPGTTQAVVVVALVVAPAVLGGVVWARWLRRQTPAITSRTVSSAT